MYMHKRISYFRKFCKKPPLVKSRLHEELGSSFGGGLGLRRFLFCGTDLVPLDRRTVL